MSSLVAVWGTVTKLYGRYQFLSYLWVVL